MESTPSPSHGEFNAAPIEPPLALQARPGPNVWMAVAWSLFFIAAQLVVGVIAAVFLSIVGIAQRGAEGFQAAMQQHGGNLLSVVPGAAIVLFIFSTSGNLLVACVVVLVLFRSDVRRTMALRRPSFLHCGLIVLLALPLALVGGWVQTLAARVLPQFNANMELFNKLAHESWVLILVFGCLLPALAEELFYRGFLSRGLVARHGLILGTVIASSLFGITHLNPPQVIGTAVLALGFQAVFLSAKSLFAPILLHGVNNAMAFGLLRLANNPTTRDVFGVGENQLIPPALFASALLAVMGLGWLFFETRTRWVLQDGRFWSPGYITAELPPAHLAATPRMTSPRASAVVVAFAAYALFLFVLFREIWAS